jgi:solute:Na+ symporter, SSS family
VLLTFIVLYLLATLLIGYWASLRVKNTQDFVIAGQKLPLIVAGSAMFATWFGSETVMGAPSEFVDGGILGVMEDPFGAALCLFLAGVLVARPLYKLKIITLNDYYRMRYGSATEFVSALFMVPSYFGWIAAQMLAMALLLNVLLGLSVAMGVLICTVIVVFYTLIGGMWAVSVTDFVQTIMIIAGLMVLAVNVGVEAGGVQAVIEAQPDGFFRFFPNRNLHDMAHYFAAWITIGLGSIPQQDVFQRVMSAKNERTAVNASYLGGAMYLTIGFIPLFIGLCGKMLHPELLEDDPQKLLPMMALKYGSIWIQILFFGALLSAILSTTSGAMLAPASVIGENLIKPHFKNITDRQLLRIMRLSVLGVAIVSAAIALSGESIYNLVGWSSVFSLVSLFVPLIAGLYWSRASGAGALAAMALGMAVWVWCEYIFPTELPSLIYGLMGSMAGMLIGSWLRPEMRGREPF